MKQKKNSIVKFLSVYVKIRVKRELEQVSSIVFSSETVIPEKEFYTKKELCSLLRISKSTLDRRIKKGIIKPRYFGGGRRVNFLRKDIIKIMGGNQND